MIVRCTASKLVVRALPAGEDTKERLKQGQTATAYGASFDGEWLYIGAPAGWVAKQFLEEVTTPIPLLIKPVWIGCAEGNYRIGRPGNPKIDMITIHVIEGSLKSCDNWFLNPAAGVSAHYGIGYKRELHQYVKEENTAYHNGRVENPTAALVKRRPGVNPNNYCCALDTRILTRDLRWVPAGDLQFGDAVVGFDEEPCGGRRRALEAAFITAASVRKEPVFRIVLATGEEIRATGEHKWIVRKRSSVPPSGRGQKWMRTDEMAHSLASYKRSNPLFMPRYFPMVSPAFSYDAGFLAGAFDGEGCIRQNADSNMFSLTMAQRPNAMLQAVEGMLARTGYSIQLHVGKSGVVQLVLSGGRDAALRFLMEHRPPRLIDRFVNKYDLAQLRLSATEDVAVSAVFPDGKAEIAALSSSSLTYVAEGFAAHNSIGIEHEGTAVSVWPETMYEDSARLVAAIAKRHDILLDRIHVVGHHEIYEPKSCPGRGDVDRIVIMAREFQGA